MAVHFSKHHGVITRSQARDLGLSRNAIARRLASGEWESLYPEVYRLAGAPKTPLQDAFAATLWAGPGAVLSHESALGLWLREAPGDGVNVSTTHRRSPRHGVTLHRVRWISPRDVASYEGVRVTTPERTVMDLAGTMEPGAFGEIVERLLRRAVVTLKSLLKQVLSVRSRWVRGRRRLRQLVHKLVRQGGKGDRLVDATDALLLRGGLDVPRAHHPLRDEEGNLHSIPLAFPKVKVALWPHDKHAPWHEKPSHQPLAEALHAAGWRLRLVEFRRLAKRFAFHTQAPWFFVAHAASAGPPGALPGRRRAGYPSRMSGQGTPWTHTLHLSGKRRSASAEASRRAQLERIYQMSPFERMKLALALRRRRRALERMRDASRNQR